MSDATTNRPLWTTPSEQPPDDYCCRRLSIPDTLEWKALVNGAVSLLTIPELFQEADGGLTVDETVQAFMELWLDYLGGYAMVGAIIGFITNVLPPNMLWCDGSTYNREDYPDLYGRLDPAYIVDADTFRTPDMRGLFQVGADETYTLGSTGGEAEHTLTEAELPAHSHTTQPHTHTEQGAVATTIPPGELPVPLASATPIPTTTGAASVTVDSTGSDQPHNNLPPYLAVRFAIVAKYRGCD
jgi:microcystin-dependent protein